MEGTKSGTEVDRKARLQIPPQEMPKRPPAERIRDWEEIYLPLDLETAKREASRCLQCPAKQCVNNGCPLHNDIPAAFALLEQGDVIGAANKFRETSPMSEACGRLCPQERLCQGKCVVGKNRQPVSIGRLEAFVADYQRKTQGFPMPEMLPSSGKRVAIVGAGPAGLAASEYLARAGHASTIFDAWPLPGGLLLYGIPSFKMNKGIVDEKVDFLKRLGVEFVQNTIVGKDLTVDDLFKQGFQAVFLGHGATKETELDIPGEGADGSYTMPGKEMDGVFWAMDFLVRSNVPPERLPPDKREPVKIGRRVAVIGGGDTAMDCVRSAVRLGAEEVTCVYRRTEAEMPGRAAERINARDEGVKFHFLAAPLRIIGDENRHVRKLECQQMELGEPDESGRRRPVPVPDAKFMVDADNVVFAIGFGMDPRVAESCSGLQTDKWGQIIADAETGATSRRGLFAAGDCVHGADLVVTAIAAAKRAVSGIDSYLKEL
ncbi:MAG: NAD(P)-dependent oxidoreductase [Dehalococcoidia bacterium]|nr:NAD(P)-dependent oxidoreductase [Dehalococcoidia bacterium]